MPPHGYSTPLSPRGTAGLVPAPPWHYVGTFLLIEFSARQDAIAELLPAGLAPSQDDPARAVALFADWQACTDGGAELLDPALALYREFFVLVAATLDGEEVMTCPYIWVDQDVSLLRGLVQGFPKKLGAIHTTRTFAAPGPASAPLAPGTTLAGTLTANGRRLAEGTVTLRAPADEARPVLPAVVNLRYFPSLQAGRHDDPAVCELVRTVQRDGTIADDWVGDATLRFFPAERDELADLAPVAVHRGRRYCAAFSVDDLEPVRDLRGGRR